MARVFDKRGEWWVDYRGSDGSRHREPVGIGATHATAKQVLAKRLAAAAEQQHFPGRTANLKTFNVVADKFWELHGKNMRSKTWKYTLGRIRPVLGSKRIGDITAGDIQAFYNEIASANSNSTANRYLTLIRLIFNKAIAWGDFRGINPCAGVKKGREAHHRLRYLSLKEIEGLLAVAHPRLAPILACALLTGMRRGEILDLAWENVDFQRERLYILRSKSGKPRELPIPSKLREVLLSLSPKPSGLVFDLPIICLRRYFAKALKDAKISAAGPDKVTLHTLRHTCASHMAMRGIDLLTIARVLGHSSTAMTQRYAHLGEDYLAAKMASYQADMPIKVGILGSSWHQGRHQAISDTEGKLKLLSYNKH